MARDDIAGKRHVTVALSQLAYEALMDDERDSAVRVTVRMENALRCYLGDKGKDRPAWPYPGFLRGSEPQGDVTVEFEVDEKVWGEFEGEAAAQEASVDQLAEHAAFYFAAEEDAGRLTERILKDLKSSDDD